MARHLIEGTIEYYRDTGDSLLHTPAATARHVEAEARVFVPFRGGLRDAGFSIPTGSSPRHCGRAPTPALFRPVSHMGQASLRRAGPRTTAPALETLVPARSFPNRRPASSATPQL